MTVGAFPGLTNLRKRAIRSPENPMDKCTVVSIYPKEIDEIKPTIQPGRFIIPPGSYEKPALLIVGTSSWWRDIDEESPLLEIPVSSIQIANSIIVDYMNGLLACNMGDTMPGLFYIPGQVTFADLLSKYKSQLDKSRDNQNRWYRELVKMADALWSRSNGNPLSISDDMRMAARELNLNTKEWLADFQSAETIRCIACGGMRNPAFPICPACHNIIDRPLYDKLGLKEAK
jgi:hypothetical protein